MNTENNKGGIMKRIVLCVMMSAMVGTECANNSLHKVFHHRRAQNNIEIGSVAFYFASNPQLQALNPKTVGADELERVFVFKATRCSVPEIQKMVQNVNGTSDTPYTLKIEQEHKDNTVKFVVRYNPHKVDVQYDSFESVKHDKGVVFRFYNKEMLQKIKEKNCTILTTACAEKRTGSIVVDCGHGGTDFGAVVDGVFEKDITLRVGLQVADLLKKKGFEVFLTRKSDDFVPLDERTSKANAQNADLFVSIHANFASNANAAGLETYCLNEGLFVPLFSTCDTAFNDVIKKYSQTMMRQSNELAKQLHNNIVVRASDKNQRIAGRKMAHAVAQVLLGAQMPAVLVELGFLSNPAERLLLKDRGYQMILAQGICQGIMDFTKINA